MMSVKVPSLKEIISAGETPTLRDIMLFNNSLPIADPNMFPLTPDIFDRTGVAVAEEEDRECMFVRNGVFEHIGGLGSPQILASSYCRKRNIMTGERYVEYHRQKSLQEGTLDKQLPPISYNPAYSDYLPLILSPQDVARQQKGDDDLTPLMWTVPFRGSRGNYCNWRRVQSGSNAGSYLQEYCPNGHHVQTAAYHCWRPNCPFCAWQWCMRKGREVEERMQAFGSGQLVTNDKWQHVVLSPPQEGARGLITTKEGLDKLYGLMFRYAKELGLQTGVAALHPWRRNKDDVLDDGSKASSFMWRAGPHFHLVAWGYVDFSADRINEFFKKTGWVVSVIKPDEDRVSLAGTIAYILSHVGLGYPVRKDGIGRQLKAFRYFGEMSNGRFRRVEILEFPSLKRCPCPTCQNYLQYMTDEGGPVPFVERIQVFCRVDKLADIRAGVEQMRKDLEYIDYNDEDDRKAIFLFHKLEFYKSNDDVFLASKWVAKFSKFEENKLRRDLLDDENNLKLGGGKG